MELRAFCLASITGLVLAACSSDSSSSGGAPGPRGGSDGGGGAATQATQRGTIVDFGTKQPVSGAVVTVNAVTTNTDASGTYSLKVPLNTPFTMVVNAPSYLTLIEQPSTLSGDTDRGQTLLPSLQLTNTLRLALTGYDAALGTISIQIIPIGGCASVVGAQVHLTGGSPSAQTRYFKSQLPSVQLASAQDNELPTAVVYNVPIGAPVTVAADGSSCKQAPYPVLYNRIAYDGTVSVQPGDSTTFVRVFMQ